MLNVTELRAGAIFEEVNPTSAKASAGGEVFQVVNYEHIKMGRGTGTVKVKVKNLKTGTTLEKTFQTGARVQDVQIERKKAQFLYTDRDQFHFMDTTDYNQFSLREKQLGSEGKFLKEGIQVVLDFYRGEPVGVEIPRSFDYKITETGPGEKGNSATNVFKPATLENGLTVKVPLFCKVGDKIKVDTRTGEYVERVK